MAAAGDSTPFGAALRRHRLAAGLSHDALAERAGLSARAISDLERGVSRAPRPATLRLLADALALAPEARTALAAAAHPESHRDPAGWGAVAAPPAPPGPPHRLPARRTSFVGREGEVAALRARLAAPGGPRLVTLTGPGGVGKTRLALEAAAALLRAAGGPDGWPAGEPAPDGVWWVDLAPLAEGALVPRAALAAVGGREGPGRPPLEALVERLRPRAALLVLDNCEHLLEACAALADALLEGCPGVRLLATSREPLGVAGEVAWPVPPLPVPPAATAGAPPPAAADPARYAAVRLFAERAVAGRPGFAVTAENAAAVAAVCRRLDGIPLALELAAARVRVLSVAQLLGRLEDRFRLLTGGPHTALPRHQTLRAAVDWSYDLLTAPERILFERLAVFAGGWTLEAAEQVCAGDGIEAEEVLDLLTRLADQSLVAADGRPDGPGRFRLLETLRQYAQERLRASGREAPVRDRHGAYYLALAEQGGTDAAVPAWPAAWLDAMERDHDNVRAALRWFGERGAHAQALALAAQATRLWYARGHMTDGLARLREVLAAAGPAARTPTGALVLRRASAFARYAGDPAQARAYLEAGLALAGELGAPDFRGQCLSELGVLAHAAGDFVTARGLQEQALALFRQIGQPDAIASALDRLAQPVYRLGDAAAARGLHEEALALRRSGGNAIGIGWSLAHLGDLAVDRGDLGEARRRYGECFAVLRGLGTPVLAHALAGCAAVAAAEGRPARSLRLLGAAAVLQEARGVMDGAGWHRAQHTTALAQKQLDPAATAAAWAAGQAMTLDQAVADALEDGPDPA